MSTVKKYVSLWGPLLALVLTNFYLSAQSRGTLGFLAENGGGKTLHTLGYLVLGIFALRVCHGGFKELSGRPILVALIGCFLWAVSDELHQLAVPGRGTTPVLDVALDTAGAVAALLLWFLVQYGSDVVKYLTHPTRRQMGSNDVND